MPLYRNMNEMDVWGPGDAPCTEKKVFDYVKTAAKAMGGRTQEAFRLLEEAHLYDISTSMDKSGLSFELYLTDYYEPYLFVSGTGTRYDCLTFAHEFGHFANGFYTESDLIFGASDNDLSELQSQGLEMIFTAFYDDIFGKYAGKVEDFVLMDMLMGVVDGAMYDEFQQRVYAEEELSAERVCEIFGRFRSSAPSTASVEQSTSPVMLMRSTPRLTES